MKPKRDPVDLERAAGLQLDVELDYTPAPADVSLAAARKILARLLGVSVLAKAEAGICDDCGREGPRWQFGRVALCRACGYARRRAAA